MMEKTELPKPLTFDEIRKKYGSARNVNIQHREKLTRLDKIALWITVHVGSMGFFIIIFVWTILWMGWNTLGPMEMRFDPYPAFVLWLFASNVLQIFLMPLIMIGQNLQSRHAELRSEQDFLIDKRAELEIESILMHLENQNEIMLKILSHIQKSAENEK
ncbi:MAG: DUF1003 domain-containing protein [Bacteroidetes bacterium]|nr:DUF1003 domain-containing protein [Bacteroidota bacterium]